MNLLKFKQFENGTLNRVRYQCYNNYILTSKYIKQYKYKRFGLH